MKLLLSKEYGRVRDGVLRGLSNQEIADETGKALRTVKHYLTIIFLKYGVTSRTELIAKHYEEMISRHYEK